VLLLFSLLIRILLFPLPGYKVDLSTFAAWFNAAAEHGIRVFYNVVWSDYPPFNVYLFWMFGSLAKQLSLSGTNLVYLIKLLPNLFDAATAFLVFVFVRKRLDFKTSLLAAALYAFNPAVIFDAAAWGQYDAIYTFFLVLSLMLVFASKPKLSGMAFTVGLLTKPQSIALAPLFVYLVLRKTGWKGFLSSLLVAAATVVVIILPFEWTNGNPVTFLSNIYFGAYSGYQYTTLNAFNIWAFGGMWVPDAGGLNIIGWVMFGALAAFALYYVHKRYSLSDELLVILAAFVLFFGFFMLPTRIHERYLFPAISMLALMFPFLKRTRPLYAVLTATCFVNQAYVLNALMTAYPSGANLTGDPVVFTVSLINSVAFVYVLMLMFGELWGKKRLNSESAKSQPALKEKDN
jgi:Gpi18-like mannosyltransferase